MSVQEAAFAYVGAFVDELARAGVRHVCICPGSRSTPIAMLCAEHRELRIWMHIDERSAGFFALGLAKASGSPVALVATSGTAVVNFMPAVVEAFYARVPLLLLTADRPPELRDVGTNQTIDQVRLYGSHVKWFVDMPLPETGETMLRYARMTAARAAATARATPAGPVHLNFPLREPLIPLPGPAAAADGSGRGTAGAGAVRMDGGPYAAVLDGPRALSPSDAAALAARWAPVQRGLIVCGPDTPEDAAAPLLNLAAMMGWPVLADPLSGLRTFPDIPGAAVVIDAYDVFLRGEEAVAALAPDLVVRFGALPVSKPLLQYLQRYADVPQFVVDGGGGWRDPTLAAATMLHVDPAQMCGTLLQELGRTRPGDGADPDWAVLWRRLNGVTRRALRDAVDAQAELFEGRVFQELAQLLPAGGALYVGNSMPIRDMDAFFPAVGRAVRVFGNRGTSGIDGVVSSGLGAGAGVDGPLVLVLGDLSFYHDLNGLLAAKLHDLDATIVVINNDGGGIFSFLPQAEHPKHFELLFGAPVGLDFEPVVRMYGGRFSRVDNWEDFRRALQRGMEEGGLRVVEVATDRTRNVQQHREVIAAAQAAIRAALGGERPSGTTRADAPDAAGTGESRR